MAKKKILKEIKSWSLTIIGAFFIAALFNTKVLAKVQVQQKSMENTLFNNQQVLLDKASYNFVKPKRGDIVVFMVDEKNGNIVKDTFRSMREMASSFKKSKDECENEDTNRFVKRVIGVPGDEIDIRDGYVYVNGKKLEETYVNGKTLRGEFELPVKVGENKLFVLGDNRAVSKDSREFGPIDLKQVDGKVIFRVYPFNESGKVK